MSITIEKEVKFRLAVREDGESRLAKLGARLTAPRHFESNQLFDSETFRVRQRGAALRLRRVGDTAWLTFKGPHHGSGKIKGRREIETSVGDANAIEAILEALGFQERFRYEKYRTGYRWKNVGLCLDETPIGDFIEIEASPEEIAEAAAGLELDMQNALVSTYPRLYELYRQESPDAPLFMVFPEDSSSTA
ncbi:MAG TPA: class IV adenylate cyclase [Vicinamibacteria bacterium]|nr:class IV adenylate cyclase [Vicinamibacteria bacterium]